MIYFLRNKGIKEFRQRDIEIFQNDTEEIGLWRRWCCHHRHTFDRAGIDKLVCHADSIERYDSARGIALHNPNTFESFFLRLYVSLSIFESFVDNFMKFV